MLLLAVDSSSDSLKVGIADEHRAWASYDGPPDRSHAERMIGAIDSVLAQAQLKPQQLDGLAVAGGPGSFTGLRVGIASVLGLSQAWDKPILTGGNPMLERVHFADLGKNPVIVIHCRANQFYLSENGRDIVIKEIDDILSGYGDSEFAGPGVARLSKTAAGVGKTLTISEPHTYNGGTLARVFAGHRQLWKQLDPNELDVNYLLKSQPEQKRDAIMAVEAVTEMCYSDLDEVLAIERDSFTDPWDRDSFRSDIDSPHVITLVSRKQGRCAGYLSCIALDDYGYIANIAVAAEHRSQGLGQKLLDDLKRRLLELGIDTVVLDVRTANENAIRFYRKRGFEVIARRKGFYTNPPDDSFTMQLTIGE